MNGLKTALLLGLLSGLLLMAGQALGGRNGLYLGLMFAIVMNGVSYFFSDKIALRSYNAQPVSETENSEIYRRVGPLTMELVQRMNIPMPKLWVIPDESPNAFATGRNPNHASVAFTVGVLRLLDDFELQGVIAHELGHVRHRDILISSVAATIASALTTLAHTFMWFGGMHRSDDEDSGGGLVGGLALMIVAPIAAGLIQMAISRTREFAADAAAAKACGTGQGLIRSLQKLEAYSRRIPMEASPATAHMFIIKPFSGESLMKLFSTHPPTEERIARLQAIG